MKTLGRVLILHNIDPNHYYFNLYILLLTEGENQKITSCSSEKNLTYKYNYQLKILLINELFVTWLTLLQYHVVV
jgi:hypothetical protein